MKNAIMKCIYIGTTDSLHNIVSSSANIPTVIPTVLYQVTAIITILYQVSAINRSTLYQVTAK